MNTKYDIIRNICKKYFSIEQTSEISFCTIKDCSDFLIMICNDFAYVSPGFEFRKSKYGSRYKFQSTESGNLKGYIKISVTRKGWEKTLEKHIKDLAYNYKIMLLKYKQKEINKIFK